MKRTANSRRTKSGHFRILDKDTDFHEERDNLKHRIIEWTRISKIYFISNCHFSNFSFSQSTNVFDGEAVLIKIVRAERAA